MTTAESIRSTVRTLITKYGSDASLYTFSNATKTESDEGEWTITDWGNAASIKVISSDHNSYKKIAARFGIETDDSTRSFLIRDDVTLAREDKITIDSTNYEITGIKKIDPIQNTNIAYIISIAENEAYD